jgi:hypothetical protein
MYRHLADATFASLGGKADNNALTFEIRVPVKDAVKRLDMPPTARDQHRCDVSWPGMSVAINASRNWPAKQGGDVPRLVGSYVFVFLRRRLRRAQVPQSVPQLSSWTVLCITRSANAG